MSVLESNDIAHPKIEALFTIDEETGMTGALKLDENILKGDILLNLDTEEDDEIGIGCAGGVDITISKSFNLTINPNLLFINGSWIKSKSLKKIQVINPGTNGKLTNLSIITLLASGKVN